MAQTTLRSYMKVNDGTKVSIKLPSDVAYTDLGVIKEGVNIVLEYDEVQEESGNAGSSDLYVKNPKAKGDFTLQNLNLDNVSKLASGMMTKVTTAASATTDIPDQTIATGWADQTRYSLVCETSSTDDTKLKLSAKPTLTSVTLDPDSAAEVLVENTEYIITEDSDSVSGYAIQFISTAMATGSPTTLTIEIVYGSNTPVSRDTYHIGSSVQKLTSFAIKLEHTDSAGLIYGREIHECYTNSGSLAFSINSAADDGFNEMPFNFTGVLNTSLTDGRQLMSVYEDAGAE